MCICMHVYIYIYIYVYNIDIEPQNQSNNNESRHSDMKGVSRVVCLVLERSNLQCLRQTKVCN